MPLPISSLWPILWIPVSRRRLDWSLWSKSRVVRGSNRHTRLSPSYSLHYFVPWSPHSCSYAKKWKSRPRRHPDRHPDPRAWNWRATKTVDKLHSDKMLLNRINAFPRIIGGVFQPTFCWSFLCCCLDCWIHLLWPIVLVPRGDSCELSPAAWKWRLFVWWEEPNSDPLWSSL